MPSDLLVSASTEVKVWDLQTSVGDLKTKGKSATSIPEQLSGVVITSFAPVDLSTAVNAVRWNHDGQQLAVAGNKGNLTIHDSQGKLLETIPLNEEGSDIPDINVVRFANKSRYVLYGGSNKIVNIWDRKESMFTEPLKGHRNTITCVDLNVDETIVASSSISGQILVHNRQKSNACDNLTVLTKQSVNVLEYSFFKRGLLAAGGEDGSLRLWDTSASSTALQTFENAHYSEIKGIAFSPFNSYLMCSGGLDKRIVLYDVGKKTTLKTIHTDIPLTALGFKANGVTMVAGTSQGKILVYDLRAASKPVCILCEHEPHSIKCLHFQEKDRSADRRNTIVKKQNHVRTSSRGSTLPASNRLSKPSPPPQTPNETKEKNYMDMFSPVKDVQVDETILNDAKAEEQNAGLFKGDILNTGAMDNTLSTGAMDNFLSTGAMDNILSTGAMDSILSTETMDDLKTRIVSKVKETIGGVKRISIGSGDSFLSNVDSPKKRVAFMDNDVMSESQKIVTTDEPATTTQNNNMINDNDDNAAMEMTTETTDFQLQVIKSAVDECLQEFRTSLRNDIQNMHLELLRQFHIQKTEIEMMFLKYCGETRDSTRSSANPETDICNNIPDVPDWM